ncbi:2OG-Fe(II) oxygenase [Bacteroidia bacterium]|nr:2OG-Fe(II) oxygenase [Bacteroidia bacterium]MDB9883181.1 2OG-Fe(II) oxygenase [Bacteroidia bacterium]
MQIGDYKILNRNYDELLEYASSHKDAYKNADPFPSIYFDDFINPEFLNEVLEEFPELGDKNDIQYKNPNEIKLASRGEQKFGPKTKVLMHFLNSEPFLNFLSELSGINNLIADPYFEGGGCHQIKPGGMLKIHADFNKHRTLGLDRRLNFLIYLNKYWKDEYGGHFELWNKDMSEQKAKISPIFNRVAMFSTTDFSFHGLPDRLTCPEGRSRKSLALYYYTNGRPQEEVNDGLEDHTTLFKERKDVASENKMKTYNRVVNLAIDLMPPLLYRTIRNIRKK